MNGAILPLSNVSMVWYLVKHSNNFHGGDVSSRGLLGCDDV